MDKPSYRKLTLLVERRREEELCARLTAAECLGLEQRDRPPDRAEVVGWYAHGSGPGGSELAALAAELAAEVVADERIEAADWLARYRARAIPFALGRSFYVDPGEPQGRAPATPPGRRLLRLPARTAFGTGSHESTRLALELMEEAELAGRRVVDVGTGTGVLSFAALLLGAASVAAFDVDPAAAFAARSNRRLNRLSGPALFAGTAEALRPSSGAAGGHRRDRSALFDLALVNVVPELILPTLPRVIAALAADGRLIFSGLLTARREPVETAAAELGLEPAGDRAAGEWAAILFVRRAPLAAARARSA